jgi:hypothetical protein
MLTPAARPFSFCSAASSSLQVRLELRHDRGSPERIGHLDQGLNRS